MLLETKDLTKQFSGIPALDHASIAIEPGEVHGLVGENGAGKSTLIKILTGVYRLDGGQIFWNGSSVQIQNPRESFGLGIHAIHQDLQLVPTFSGIENAYLGLPYETTRFGSVDWRTMRKRVLALAEELGIEMNFDIPAARLSPPNQTMLSLIRALMTDCRLLILDEPTASLTDRETAILFRTIDKLKKKGVSILYVTHRMDEIFTLTDRVTVMKNGKVVGTFLTKDVDKDDLIGKMTDDYVTGAHIEKNRGIGEGKVRLSVAGLKSKDGRVRDVSLEARSGEILGIFGLGGSGRTELLETIYGYRQAAGGEVKVDEQVYSSPSPGKSIQRGMVLLCEDRRGMALIMPFSIAKNITLSGLSTYAPHGVIKERAELNASQKAVSMLGIRCNSPEQPVRELSGGNQQKVVFAKALETDPAVLLCDEPTQAVDVGTRQEIHRLLRNRADAGSAVVFVSSDLQELLETADRIQILSDGMSGECLVNENLTSEEVLMRCYKEADRA